MPAVPQLFDRVRSQVDRLACDRSKNRLVTLAGPSFNVFSSRPKTRKPEVPTSSRIGTRNPVSAIGISVSPVKQPDSRRSAKRGRWSWRSSEERFNLSAITGLQFAGEELELPRNLGDPFLTRVATVFRIDELQIVDDHEANVVVPMQAVRIRGNAHHALCGVSSMKSLALRSFSPAASSLSESSLLNRPVRSRWLSTRGLTAKQTLGNFDARLLQTDEEYRLVLLGHDMSSDVQSKRCFADRRSCREDDQLVGLKTGGLLIQVKKSRRHAACRLVRLAGAPIDAMVCFFKSCLQINRLPRHAEFGDFEDLARPRRFQAADQLEMLDHTRHAKSQSRRGSTHA